MVAGPESPVPAILRRWFPDAPQVREVSGWLLYAKLDEDHRASCLTAAGKAVGVLEKHRRADGAWCEGVLHIVGPDSWEVVQESPLTLSPSIDCSVCPAHGYIREGRWVDA